ncbi:LPXTG cell wall anchor domain-containing protein [Kitasatospora herbaricolor]|uniref:LPXTG cell wall anchor domain-containing protein n=1 Tax=Kitasatospora herbaricolor TaxID=68217 RepID=A0ABZ1WGQ4_9ACTN|nr:LPXTG cell wall anchor domain-containing protein [Kitasatospora herbaricolor]
MSVRRSLVLAGTAALTSSALLVGVEGVALAASPSTPSAPALRFEIPAQQRLDLAVAGVPGTFTTGAAPREFGYTISNPSAHDFVAFPLLKFKNRQGDLRAADLTVEYQLPGSSTWLAASVAPGGDGADDSVVILLGGTDHGSVSDEALLAVRKGKSVTLKVRVAFAGQAPLGKAGLVPVAFSAQLDDGTGMPVDQGSFACACEVGCVGFTIKAPAPATPTAIPPSPTPVQTRQPSPTHSPASAPPPKPVTPSSAPPPSAKPVTPSSNHLTASPGPSASVPSGPAASPSPTATRPGPSSASPSGTGPASPTAPAPSTSEGGPEQVSFPIATPAITPLVIPPAAVAKAKTTADTVERSLAQTGGGGDSTMVAVAGAALLGTGASSLVVFRRRRSARHA